MYVDGHLTGRYGETHKVSALETLQFATISVVPDITRCVSMDSKVAGDLVYVVGLTRNELGGSEYYDHLGYVGLNVPRVCSSDFVSLYRAISQAITKGLVASVHGIYRGGLGVHLAMVAMGGGLGMHVDLRRVPAENAGRDDTLLFSESAGRFIVTLDPGSRTEFESAFKAMPCACIGTVTAEPVLNVDGLTGAALISVSVCDLKRSWKTPFGHLI
jgi:phosphoribosylformylglycinamidine synthase